MNPRGNSKTLQARQLGNQNRVTHGAYARQEQMPERANEIADGILAAVSHLSPVDQLLVEELARLQDHLERLEVQLAEVRFPAKQDWRWDLRLRLSGRIERLCGRLGLTPEARVGWLAALTQPISVEDAIAEVRRKREELNNG